MSLYEISSMQGLKAQINTHGATVCSIQLHGQEMTLIYASPEDYVSDPFYLGSTVGPYANRIDQARFSLNGTDYVLTANDGLHCLHGGAAGINHVEWQVDAYESDRLTLSYEAQDGEGGFPGHRVIRCQFLVKETELHFNFHATTTADTILSLTNHCYFNLDQPQQDICHHRLECFLPHFLQKNSTGIPTGRIGDTVTEYPELINPLSLDSLLQRTGGIDHCFITNSFSQNAQLQARLWSSDRSLSLSVFSDLPGVQIYTGDGLSSPFQPRQGLCLEAQHWPDAPNRPDFPAASLAKDQTYQHQIIYRFEIHAEP